jgi:Caspase domain
MNIRSRRPEDGNACKMGFLARSMILLAALATGFAAAPQGLAEERGHSQVLQTPGNGTVRALVVGIDKYPNLSERVQLSGAAADAKDIAAALKRVGAGNVTLLLDTNATRSAFLDAMETLVQQAQSGDLIVLAFAGHGSQEKERIPGSKPDGKNEEFILSLIREEGPNTAERLLDDEVFDWLKRIAAKGAEVIFVADSCHGGGMTKAPERGSVRIGVRGLTRVYNENEAGPGTIYIAPGADQLPASAHIASTDNATLEIPSLTFLAGVDPWSEVMEITIDGQRRGALSYAFARALDSASLNGDITREKLFKFVHEKVLQQTQHQQRPVLEPRTAETARRVLFRKSGAAAAPAAPMAAGRPPETSIVTSQGAADPAGLAAYWDKVTGDVISETRTVLAYKVPQAALPAVAQRVSVTAALAKMAAEAPLQADLQPPAKDFASGQNFKLVIEGVYGRYLMIVNLAGNGEVQYLYPTGNAVPLIMDNNLAIAMHAEPPFGTDTLIVIASQKQHPNLELDISLLDKQLKPMELLSAVQNQLEANDLLGVISYSTHP